MKRSTQGPVAMELLRRMMPGQFASVTEGAYEPPRIEVVVTSAELEREALYAGEGIYGTF